MIKALVAIGVVGLVIATLAPIAVYFHFSNVVESYREQIYSYEFQISELQKSTSLLAHEEYKAKVKEFMKGSPYDPYLMEPYLMTRLGWYLHDGADPIPESRYKLTIYGEVLNIGSETAYNCKLTIYIYGKNSFMQASEVNIGTISHWAYKSIRENIYCNFLRYVEITQVERIEVERTWTNTP